MNARRRLAWLPLGLLGGVVLIAADLSAPVAACPVSQTIAPQSALSQESVGSAVSAAAAPEPSSNVSLVEDAEGMYQKCGQDCLYLALRNIGFEEFTWTEADQLLGGSPTTTLESLQSAAESMGVYAAVARIRGNQLDRIARFDSTGQSISLVVYLEPRQRYSIGHFAVIPWVSRDKLFYIDPIHGGTVAELDSVQKARQSLCLLISDTPLDLACLESSILESVFRLRTGIGILGITMIVVSALVLVQRSRRILSVQRSG